MIGNFTLLFFRDMALVILILDVYVIILHLMPNHRKIRNQLQFEPRWIAIGKKFVNRLKGSF